MIKLLAIAGILILILCAVIQVNYNLGPLAVAISSPLETIMSRMYTDNPANETLYMAYPTVSQDSLGAVHFVGEVVNRGNEPARFAEIIATFYDSQNRVLGTDNTFTNPTTILPGLAAPFELIVGFGDTIQVAYIDHVKFHLDWRDSNHPTGGIKILSVNNFFDHNQLLPGFHVVGEIQNNSTHMDTSVQVVVTLYDNNSQVVGTANTYATPSTILPGAKVPFEIIVTQNNVKDGDLSTIKDLKLQVSGIPTS